MPSESKLRQVASTWTPNDIEAECAPFSFKSSESPGEELRPAPIAFVTNLWKAMKSYLSAYDE